MMQNFDQESTSSTSPTDSVRAVISHWQKNVHQVFVNGLGGLHGKCVYWALNSQNKQTKLNIEKIFSKSLLRQTLEFVLLCLCFCVYYVETVFKNIVVIIIFVIVHGSKLQF